MDGKHQMALGAITVLVVCVTVLMTIIFIALWPQRTVVAWCLLASFLVAMLVSLLRSLNAHEPAPKEIQPSRRIAT